MKKACWHVFVFFAFASLYSFACVAQEGRPSPTPVPQKFFREEALNEFGPIVRSYLDYLEAEQDVTDDRASRREINRAYYIRNTNRIRALRQTIIRIASETGNDYVPELEAVALDELRTLFEKPPDVKILNVGEILNNTFRYLGRVRAGVTFYIFQRLDIYEQEELVKKQRQQQEEQKKEQKTETKTATATTAKEPEETRQKKPRR